MGVRFEVCLEYDGKKTRRNDFICRLDDDTCYIHLKNWKGLYDSDLRAECIKENSLKLERMTYGYYLSFSWGIDKIVPKIKLIKRTLRTDKELELYEKKELKDIINDLQMLYDLSMENCTKRNLEPKKCYVVWWISY
jgi:hypothetical protein